ncbi:MFS transporter [Promicromonospora sp. MEB111]|uniref:MFS transporter n=1 Tax=Promicromonospora sp. MEB111 TaxID=3040301 RepID=UPI00254BF99D|nr:MFS transporter [Promicromonospora sp. MEB111]
MASTGDRLPARYWRLWWAGAIDNVGNGALVTALPLLAVTLTADPRLVSMVAAASFVPWLLFALPAGAIADRFSRIAVMRSAQAFQAVAVTALAVLVAAGAMDVVALMVAAFLVGVGQVGYGIASQSVVPEIVEHRLLGRANARQYLATTVGQSFIGPPVGSLLFGLAIALPFGLDGAALVVSALLLARLRGMSQPRGAVRSAGPAVIEGLRWLVGHRLLRTLALLLGVNTFCFQLGNVTLVLLATGELGVGVAGYGVLLAVAAVGSVLGGLLAARLVTVFGQIPVLIVALAVNAVVFVLLGLSPDAWILAALLALSGLATAVWSVLTVTLRQELVPLALLGRVNSVYRLLGWGLIPLGALAGGLIAHEISVRAGYPIAGTLRAVALVVSLPLLLRAHRQGPRPQST